MFRETRMRIARFQRVGADLRGLKANAQMEQNPLYVFEGSVSENSRLKVAY